MRNRKGLGAWWERAAVSFLSACFLGPFGAAQTQRSPVDRDRERQRWEWFYEQRAYPLDSVPAGARWKALEALDRMRAAEAGPSRQPPGGTRASFAAPGAAASSGQWSLIGPQPTIAPSGPFGFPISSGRVNALAVDPRDANVVYLGAAVGGVWKTTDGGLNWTPLTDSQPSLAVGSMTLDPSNPDIVYVGTGDESLTQNAYYGAGILKSTDGGATWTHLPGSFVGPFDSSFLFGGARLASLAVHPTNGQILLAAVKREPGPASGIYRSTDGGVSWTNILPGLAMEVLFDPTNGNIAYAALGAREAGAPGSANNGVYKSTDTGRTWSRAGGAGPAALPAAAGVKMAIAPSSPATLYAGISDGASLLGFFKTVDGGSTWAPLPNTPDYCKPQCGTHHVIRAHPSNANLVFAGGIALYRSLDGGTTWTDILSGANGISSHIDQRALAFSAGGAKLYVGNDGGAWSATDAAGASVNWANLNATLAITQFYPGHSIHPLDVHTGFGGTQDNGTLKYTGSLEWNYATCGDGGWTAIDTAAPGTVYAACQRIDIQKSTANGAAGSWLSSNRGIDTSDRVQFIPPFVMDPANPRRLYFGTFRVYQTNNGADSWTVISPDLTGGQGRISTIAVAPGNSNIVCAGTTDGRLHVTSNAGAGTGAAWMDRSAGLPGRFVTQIAVDLGNPMIAYVTLSGFSGFGDTQGHIFRTTNGGVSWTDISGNLPNIPVNDVLIDPDLAGALYVATDVGVFQTTDGGAIWSPLGSGLPRVVVMGLKLHRRSRTLRAATFGRSMWDLSIPVGNLAPIINSGGVVNGASFAAGAAVAAGSIASVFGANLASSSTVAGAAPLPTTLGGASVRANGIAAPLFFVSPSQINFQIPWELLGQTQASITVTVNGVTSSPQTINLAVFAPGIFATNQQGSGQGAILDAQGRLVDSAAPARRGDLLQVFCNGLGAVTNPPPSGATAAGNPLSTTTTVPTVTIGGIPAAVSFSGLAPGFVGLYQVNVRVPDNAPIGSAVPVVLTIGGATSNPVTLAVQQRLPEG